MDAGRDDVLMTYIHIYFIIYTVYCMCYWYNVSVAHRFLLSEGCGPSPSHGQPSASSFKGQGQGRTQGSVLRAQL